jgi:hypothetical protein
MTSSPLGTHRIAPIGFLGAFPWMAPAVLYYDGMIFPNRGEFPGPAPVYSARISLPFHGQDCTDSAGINPGPPAMMACMGAMHFIRARRD